MEIDLAIKPHGEPTPYDPDEPHYPSVHLESHEPLNLPENGTIKFHFKKVGANVSERNGKKHYSCELELHVVLGAKADDEHPEEEKSDSKKTSDALDSHAREYKTKAKGAY